MNKHLFGKRGMFLEMRVATFVAMLSALVAHGQPGIPLSPGLPTLPAGAPANLKNTGLILKEKGVSDGYVLIAAPGCSATYLINNDGFVVHEWNHQKTTGMSAYLMPNGNLLRTVRDSSEVVGDTIQKIAWDGQVVWEYSTDQSVHRIHHDIEPLPNGNVLVTVWERIPDEEYVKAGRNPETVPNNEMWVDAIHEVRATGTNTGEVVWRWSPWDHIIQNFDEKRANYGNPADHPDRIDLNQLREETGRFNKLADWLHINALSYNPERDEIMLSSQSMSEIWVVSRVTGAIVYRWGNPRRYGKGGDNDQVLFNQHDAHTITTGYRGGGNILLFNNTNPVSPGEALYSSVLEVKPPLTDAGGWPAPTEEGIFPPCEVVWEYSGRPDGAFYSPIYSNAQRLKGGGTLIGVGAGGTILELDEGGKLVWQYVNPKMLGRVKLKKLEQWNALPPPEPNTFFRAYKYTPDYPAFVGRDLAPKYVLGSPLPEADVSSPSQP